MSQIFCPVSLRSGSPVWAALTGKARQFVSNGRGQENECPPGRPRSPLSRSQVPTLPLAAQPPQAIGFRQQPACISVLVQVLLEGNQLAPAEGVKASAHWIFPQRLTNALKMSPRLIPCEQRALSSEGGTQVSLCGIWASHCYLGFSIYGNEAHSSSCFETQLSRCLL